MTTSRKLINTKALRVVLPAELYEWIEAKAKMDSRKLSAMVRLIIEKARQGENG